MSTDHPRLGGIYARDQIIWLQFQGRDDYGDPLAYVEASIPARVTWKVRRVTNRQGEEVIASGSVLMHAKPSAGEDRIRIDSVDHLIVAVKENKGFARVYSYEAYIQ